MDTIVVGVDGSPNSAAALGWAVEEARLRDAQLMLVHGWTQPVTEPGVLAGGSLLDAAVESTANETLQHAVASVRALGSAHEPQARLRCGSPGRLLVEVAEELQAALLVVGSRGRGGFLGLLLGSVASEVAHRAACPVVIVPPSAAA